MSTTLSPRSLQRNFVRSASYTCTVALPPFFLSSQARNQGYRCGFPRETTNIFARTATK
jgi:hypothetical protein